MRQHLRAAAVVLIALLSLSQAAVVYCAATCGPEQGQPAGRYGESSCHSSRPADADATRIEGVDFASCDHDLPSDLTAVAQQETSSSRPALRPSGWTSTRQGGPQNHPHPHPESRQELRPSSVVPLPLRI